LGGFFKKKKQGLSAHLQKEKIESSWDLPHCPELKKHKDGDIGEKK
jgi:hypothetical protein